jgi:hypothetical protein
MDARLTDAEIKQRGLQIRRLYQGLHIEDCAKVCLAARIVRADEGDMRTLSKFKLMEDLAREKPDPRNLKLATDLGIEQNAKTVASGLTINIVPHVTQDTSLPNIIAECDEVILEDMANALSLRAVKLTRDDDSDLIAAMRGLFDTLFALFGRKPGGAKGRLR